MTFFQTHTAQDPHRPRRCLLTLSRICIHFLPSTTPLVGRAQIGTSTLGMCSHFPQFIIHSYAFSSTILARTSAACLLSVMWPLLAHLPPSPLHLRPSHMPEQASLRKRSCRSMSVMSLPSSRVNRLYVGCGCVRLSILSHLERISAW